MARRSRSAPAAPKLAPRAKAGDSGLGTRVSGRRRAFVSVLAGCLVAYLAFEGYHEIRKARYRSQLPPLPTFTHEPQKLRDQLEAADRAARAMPTTEEMLVVLGQLYHANMFYVEADRVYGLAESLASGTLSWRPTYYRALVQETRGDGGAVTVSLRRVVAEAPYFSPAWWRLGEAEFKLGNHPAAVAAWEHARRLPEPTTSDLPPGPVERHAAAPISAYAALGIARVALAAGDAERARQMLEEATTAAPAFGPGVRMLGTAYAALGRSEDAERVIRRADRLPGYDPYLDPIFTLLARQSNNPTFLLQQAAAADVNTNGAWREYLTRRALELDPENADALEELATLLRVLRRFDEALALLRRLEQRVPGDPRVVADIGRCLSGLRRYDEAEQVLRRALAGLDDANARYDLGLVLDRTGRTVEAMNEYRLALARNPTHRDALNNLGVALARAGRMAEAAGQFERLVAADPANPDAHTNLGAMLLSTGRPERAAQEFRAALEIDPGNTVARDALAKTNFPKIPVARGPQTPSIR